MFQPAISGLIVGVLLIFFPQVLGVGYAYVDQALNGGLLLRTVLLLCVAKLVATIVSYASGNAGGIFAPSLYLGAMAGGAIGILMHRYAPFPTGDPGAYALVGMGTLFAGIVRAPMTSVFMIFELTQDYEVLVPLMIANMIRYAISRQFQPLPPVSRSVASRSNPPASGGTRPTAGQWHTGDVMTSSFQMIPPDTTVDKALAAIIAADSKALLVGSGEFYSGIVNTDQLKDAIQSGKGADSIASLLVSDTAHVHPDHSLDFVLERLSRTPGILPVVSRSEVS
jgi:CIC family chloride channel protein